MSLKLIHQDVLFCLESSFIRDKFSFVPSNTCMMIKNLSYDEILHFLRFLTNFVLYAIKYLRYLIDNI